MPSHDLANYTNYGNGTTTGYWAVSQWAATTEYAIGQFRRPLTSQTVGNERLYLCIQAGTSGGTEPTWTYTRGALQPADGTVLWMECTGQAGFNGDFTYVETWANTWYTGTKSAVLGEVTMNNAGTYLFICTTAGTCGNSEPSWNTTVGATSNSGTAIWTCIGPTSNYTTPFGYPHARLSNAVVTTWAFAGMKHAIASVSAETAATAITINSVGTQTLPNEIYSIDVTTTLAAPTLAVGASVTTTGASNLVVLNAANTYGFCYGVSFSAGSGANAAIMASGCNFGSSLFEYCSFALGTTNGPSQTNSLQIGQQATDADSNIYRKCNFSLGVATQQLCCANNSCGALCIECTFCTTGAVPTTLFYYGVGTNAFKYEFIACDFSAITGTLITKGRFGEYNFLDCKFADGVTIFTGSASGGTRNPKIRICNSDSTATNTRYYLNNELGTAQSETSIVRTSGSSDGTTPLSWKISSFSKANAMQPFMAEDLIIPNWAVDTPITVSVYLTTNSAQTNKEFYLDVEFLGNASFPIGSTVSSRCALLQTPTALPADEVSSWGGAAKSYKYKVTSPSFTPRMAGPIKVTINQAIASIINYVDLKPAIENA